LIDEKIGPGKGIQPLPGSPPGQSLVALLGPPAAERVRSAELQKALDYFYCSKYGKSCQEFKFCRIYAIYTIVRIA
jgi:hypothetical protein